MKYCLKWENVEIIGFQVYKWNEMLMMNNISDDNAIFVLRRHPDCRIKRILQVKLRSLLEPLSSSSAGNFRARADSSAFSSVLFQSGLFWMKSPEDERVVKTLASYTRSSFEFSGFTVNCPYAPRLVFVLDFSYTPAFHFDCPSNKQMSVLPALPICSVPHNRMNWELSESTEEYGLRMVHASTEEYGLQMVHACDSEPEDDMVDSDEEDPERDPDDPENRYSDETKELVRRLRRYRHVGRTLPLMPRSDMDPVGMVEVGRPMMWALVFLGGGDCEICKGKMNVGDVVVRLNCEHKFHRDCAWISAQEACPLCNAPTARTI